MRANRRRQRTPDPLAHPGAVRAVLDQLREHLPKIIPVQERQAIKLLNAVRNIERRPAADTQVGRPARWERNKLLRVAKQLRSILGRETNGRVSLNSFIGLYTRVLDFPKDVTKALTVGEVTLFEAAQLARLSAKRLGSSPAEACDLRSKLLKSHLMMQGSQSALQARVNEQLGLSNAQTLPKASGKKSETELVDELLNVNPSDSRHLFWEELRRIAFALKSVVPEDLDDKTLREILLIGDRLSGVLARLEKKHRLRGRTM